MGKICNLKIGEFYVSDIDTCKDCPKTKFISNLNLTYDYYYADDMSEDIAIETAYILEDLLGVDVTVEEINNEE